MASVDEENSGPRLGRIVLIGVLLVALGAMAPMAVALFMFMALAAGAASEEHPSERAREEIPAQFLSAYMQASEDVTRIAPQCEGLDWALLAGVGKVESDHGAGSTVTAEGEVTPWIRGPALDGSGGNMAIPDTDDGVWDDDTTWDRAVGPMQFIPTSWDIYGQDGNDDGIKHPHNLYDATLAAAAHLCGSTPIDLSDPIQVRGALLRYNASVTYGTTVLQWAALYRSTGGPPQINPPPPGDGGPWGGFENGKIPLSAMCAIPWDPTEHLRCDATAGLRALNEHYRAAFGTDLPLTDTYRSYERQVSVRAYWCSLGMCHMAAIPGTSNHGWGLSVDFAGGIASFGTVEHNWMLDNAHHYGWHHPEWAKPGGGKEEPWHWNWGDAGGDPHE